MRRLYYSDDEFGKAFSDKLKDHREIPPSGNWAAINSRLNQRSHKKYVPYRWAAAIIGTLFFLGVVINYSTRDQKKLHLTETEQRYLKNSYSNTASDVSTAAVKVETRQDKNNAATNTTDIVKLNNAVALSSNTIKTHYRINHLIGDIDKSISRIDEALNNSGTFVEKTDVQLEPLATINKNSISNSVTVHFISIPQNDVPEFINNTDASKKVYLVTKDCSNSNLKFYAGVTGLAQHTYLLSSTILKSPKYKYRFSPGYAFGIVTGYNILPKLSVESGLIFSNENQNYSSSEQNPKRPNIAVKTNTEWVELNYYRVPLLVKYKISTSGSKCICDESINIVGGLQYGRFAGGRTYNGVSAYNLTNDFIKQNDLQFTLGVERSKAISKHLVFNGGIRFAYSDSQISSTHSLRINEIYKPHNFNSAITLALTYR